MSANIVQSGIEPDLMQLIPGYNGYESPAQRVRSDKHFREYLAGYIQHIVIGFGKIESRLSENDVETAKAIQKIIRQLTQVTDAMQSPAYMGSEFFHSPRIDGAMLAELHETDTRIYDDIHYIASEVAFLEQGWDTEDATTFLGFLFDAIDSLNHSLVEREFLLIEPVDESPIATL
ncbi:hypothetical protein JW960_16545 [candidate division KSB1 bacterium]|nr:hypothetical protein [candidate division KSB1 bacterium]